MRGPLPNVTVAFVAIIASTTVVIPAAGVAASTAATDTSIVDTSIADTSIADTSIAETTATPMSPATSTRTTTITAVYPNPVTDGDRGEFVVLNVTSRSDLSSLALSDGEQTVPVPNVTASGRVVLTGHPGPVNNITGGRIVALPTALSLANSKERVALRASDENRTVATARYRDAPEGEVGRYDGRRSITWGPVGRTDRPIVAARGGAVRAFTLPDAPGVPLSVIRDADRRIRLAGYTLTSRRIAGALVAAQERGVDVRVLVEGSPVDGMSRGQARLLDRLVDAGIDVRAVGGPLARYDFHHAKYAVADGRAVVLTENWKPAGTGGASSRGWGVVVSQSRIVDGLAATFRADANWSGTIPWRQFRRGRAFERVGTANGSYPSEIEPARVPVNRTRLLVTPDNAGSAVVATLDNATESIDVIQMTIDGPDQRFLRATIRAARRGVGVRILLSSAWYVREDNRKLVERLRERARAEGLPIEAKLADPRGRFEKIHAKGVVVDGDQVLLGSLNWNGESITNNREVVLSLSGEAVGGYYQRAFERDWSGPQRQLPVSLLAAVVGALVLAVLVARRIEFGDRIGVGPGE